jgi:hypothetical protein
VYRFKHSDMQQVFSITSVLKLSTAFVAAMSFTSLAFAKSSSSKPIEVLSDPYGYGVPTHYTILRGHTKVTFSNPIFGQFTRAEISMREKAGNRITRFTLSADAKSYRPTLIQFQPFGKHGYPEVDPFCLDPKAPSPILNVTSLGPAVKTSELIAKKREELTKAKFFDASCFDPSIKEDHRNAIMNAAADIFTTETQVREGKSTFLRCLEDNGFAHESGLIQAYAKQAISEKNLNPRLRLSCTADKKAKPGEFDEESKMMTIKQSLKPDRDSYATLIFHEALHAVPLQDGISTDLIEECCTLGERCDELSKIGEARKSRDRETALLEPLRSDVPIATGVQTAVAGGETETVVKELENGFSCASKGGAKCGSFQMSGAVAASEFANQKMCLIATQATNAFNPLEIFLPSAALASSICKGSTDAGVPATTHTTILDIQQKHNARTYAELAPHLPVTSPISWDVPQTQMLHASNDSPGETPVPAPRQSRTIASIAPLPEPSTTRSLGSASGRRDVSSTNRATRLVDTLETAARKVTTTLTIEKLDARRIETTEAFRPRTKDQPAQKLIVASLAGRPLQISNIADINDLSFPNPFANEKSEQRTQPAQPVNGLAGNDRANGAPNEGGSETRSPSVSAIASAMVGSATEKLTQSSGLTPSMAGSPTKFQSKEREPTSNKKSPNHDFEKMTATELKRFVIGGYRAVAAELENQEFAKALSKNGIQIYDHENRQIGAMEPALVDGVLTHTVFIYSAEKSRLIQSRTSKRNTK